MNTYLMIILSIFLTISAIIALIILIVASILFYDLISDRIVEYKDSKIPKHATVTPKEEDKKSYIEYTVFENVSMDYIKSLGNKDANTAVKETIIKKLSDLLSNDIELTSEYDNDTQEYTITGSIKVTTPDESHTPLNEIKNIFKGRF